MFVLGWSAWISPLSVIIALWVGLWAWRSQRARLMGMLSVVTAAATGITGIGIFAWYTIHPPPKSDPDLNALIPLLTFLEVVGPMAIVHTVLIPITTILALCRKRSESESTKPPKPKLIKFHLGLKIAAIYLIIAGIFRILVLVMYIRQSQSYYSYYLIKPKKVAVQILITYTRDLILNILFIISGVGLLLKKIWLKENGTLDHFSCYSFFYY